MLALFKDVRFAVRMLAKRPGTTLVAIFTLAIAASTSIFSAGNTVARRTHELGVRMALGAQPRAVVSLVVRQGMVLVGLGKAVGLVGAVALTHSIPSILSSEVGATEPPTFIGVALALLVVGLVATYIPARRATRIDPMVALRHE